MSEKRSQFMLKLESYGAGALSFVLGHLPARLSLWCGRRIGDVLRIVDKRHRERCITHVMDRLGLSEREARQFAKRNFRHYGSTLAEVARLATISRDEVVQSIDFGGFLELLRSVLDEGHGAMFITCHSGNWEWAGVIRTITGIEGGAIARPLDNPIVNEQVRALRERHGMRILDKQGAIRKGMGLLKHNKILAVLIDQDAGPAGFMSPFFGKPASTITIPVQLAMRLGTPMLPLVLKRVAGQPCRFVWRYSPEPVRADPDADPEEETKRIIDRLNLELEKLIMEEPEQWMWIHRRWKTQKSTARGPKL